jgi:hypothetical protein
VWTVFYEISLIQSVLAVTIAMSNCFRLIQIVKSKSRMHLTGLHLTHLEGCMWIARTEIKPHTGRLNKQKQCQNISLLTDFITENYWVASGSVCNSKLVAFLIHCHEVSINYPYL